MLLNRVFGCLFVVTLASGIVYAQVSPKVAHTTHSPAVTRMETPAGLKVIFSNLGPTPTNAYNDTTGYYVIGPNNSVGFGEQWIALPFTPQGNAHATEIRAAIGIISGTSLVDIGLYSDSGGTVGTLLAGGSATTIPAFGSCCGIVTVSIPSTALAKGTQYWVVASSDDVNAPDFTGVFESSNQSTIAYNPALLGWFNFSGNVPAMSVRGTIP